MNWTGIGALMAFLGVALGAFGAHALQERLDPYFLDIYKTSTHYLMIHALALILIGLFQPKKSWPGWCFFLGILIFSGSLYLLVLSGIRIFGAITPLGGLLFMAGWIGFALEARIRGART
jgi:uncharacterized membrane protein YgdD (TMEM256/DUF423 family)